MAFGRIGALIEHAAAVQPGHREGLRDEAIGDGPQLYVGGWRAIVDAHAGW
jgi:hypothetical protein